MKKKTVSGEVSEGLKMYIDGLRNQMLNWSTQIS